MRIVAILAAALLAACGADGEPEPPEPQPRGTVLYQSEDGRTRVGVSGEVTLGVNL